MENIEESERQFDKFNDGYTCDLKTLSSEELNLAFKSISEGCESLEELLRVSLANGITTRFCCAGHEDEANPHSYVSFDFEEIPKEYLASILRTLGQDRVDFVDISNAVEYDLLTVYCTIEDRDKMFSTLVQGIKTVDRDNLTIPKEYERMILLHERVSKYEKQYFNASNMFEKFKAKFIGKAITLGSNMQFRLQDLKERFLPTKPLLEAPMSSIKEHNETLVSKPENPFELDEQAKKQVNREASRIAAEPIKKETKQLVKKI